MINVYQVQLRTGFFKTEPYALDIEKTHLTFVPMENQHLTRLRIPQKSIQAIELVLSERLEFDIITDADMYSGHLEAKEHIDTFIHHLSKNFQTCVHLEHRLT